ncbi:GerAB/ArcD/ProY family transporter [Paenibacillus solisilvae]|uniref:GerAB/ArcD/ProY family transporter n=1 Tax=Paenibacillus solisilvae TaxID=2486751 RepID=A0ABW0W3C8_9BACL
MEAKFSAIQSFTLILALLLGTAIIIGTPRLAPDVWLVEIIAVVPAILMFLMYTLLFSADSTHTGLYSLLVNAWGRYLGKLFVLGYAIYFLYIAARNVRDMIELVMTTLLRSTPPHILVVLFVCLVAYAGTGGIKVLGRLSEVIVGLVILFFCTLGLFLAMSGSIDMERVLPILSQGAAPIIKASFTSSLWFPYGEIIVFLVFYSSMGGRAQFRKAGIAALVTACAVLTLSDLLQICTLGMQYGEYSAFPLLDAARLIDIADIITRMDALVAIIIIFGVLLKCAVFLYAGAKGVSSVFRSSSHSYIFPLALIIGAMSIMITHNFAEHGQEGLHYVMYILHIPFQLLLPLLTGIIIWIRRGKRGDKHDDIKQTDSGADSNSIDGAG